MFGFNRAEAVKSFRRAAELDPKAAMAYWGIALALGQHINMDLDGDVKMDGAHTALRKALSVSSDASEAERAYVNALERRISIDPKVDRNRLSKDYKDAMRELTRRYPDDLDAATLYAESLMVLSRWRWWNKDGRPEAGTEEAVSVMEAVLKRNPLHPGANHFYIHAIEMSPHPERALESAARLMSLVPGAGHLVHMPGHIFMRVGDYELAARSNELAVKADQEYMRLTGAADPVYTLGYYPHNLHFIVTARILQGRFEEAKQAADLLTAQVAPRIKDMPMMADYFLPVSFYVLLRFQRWDDILKSPAPDKGLAFSRPFWHYARATALSAKGRSSEARKEQQAFEETRKEVPNETMFANCRAADVLEVAAAALKARLVRNDLQAIEHWKKAVAAQDALPYDEPPPWYYPVRESLGGAFLRIGRAAEAEAVFRESLKLTPRNGRALFGLIECLKAQKKTLERQPVQDAFERNWNEDRLTLRVEDL